MNSVDAASTVSKQRLEARGDCIVHSLAEELGAEHSLSRGDMVGEA